MKQIASWIIIFALSLCGCATTLQNGATHKPAIPSQFPPAFKALQKITMQVDGKSYEWMGYAMLKPTEPLVIHVMEPSGVPVIRMEINREGAFRVLQVGAQPKISGFQQILADCLGVIYLSESYPMSDDVITHYSGQIHGVGLPGQYPRRIELDSPQRKFTVQVEVLNIKSVDWK